MESLFWLKLLLLIAFCTLSTGESSIELLGLGLALRTLEAGTCIALLIVVFETPISFLFEIDSVLKT
jgi:hypothetical protein